MDDREQADALARELVALGAFRWVAGMTFRYRDSRGDGRKYGPWHTARMSEGRAITGKRDHPPGLLDETTAYCLMGQAMERGCVCMQNENGEWVFNVPDGQCQDMTGDYYEVTRTMRAPDLGVVAARALIASKGGG